MQGNGMLIALVAPPLHTFGSLGLAPDGRRVVSLETDERPDAPTSTVALVARDVVEGRTRVVASCEQSVCRLASPTWAER
jgi:hypothetical protein